ncbi:MAG: cytochrome c [Thermodesulfobacteriota bacterium]
MYWKPFICLCMLTCLLWATAAIAPAGEGGKLFIQKCGSCHQQGGKVKPVNPADKAEVVWQKYFKRDRHPVKLSTIGSDDELAHILEYLQQHAADSDFPEAAAIPRG